MRQVSCCSEKLFFPLLLSGCLLPLLTSFLFWSSAQSTGEIQLAARSSQNNIKTRVQWPMKEKKKKKTWIPLLLKMIKCLFGSILFRRHHLYDFSFSCCVVWISLALFISYYRFTFCFIFLNWFLIQRSKFESTLHQKILICSQP